MRYLILLCVFLSANIGFSKVISNKEVWTYEEMEGYFARKRVIEVDELINFFENPDQTKDHLQNFVKALKRIEDLSCQLMEFDDLDSKLLYGLLKTHSLLSQKVFEVGGHAHFYGAENNKYLGSYFLEKFYVEENIASEYSAQDFFQVPLPDIIVHARKYEIIINAFEQANLITISEKNMLIKTISASQIKIKFPQKRLAFFEQAQDLEKLMPSFFNLKRLVLNDTEIEHFPIPIFFGGNIVPAIYLNDYFSCKFFSIEKEAKLLDEKCRQFLQKRKKMQRDCITDAIIEEIYRSSILFLDSHHQCFFTDVKQEDSLNNLAIDIVRIILDAMQKSGVIDKRERKKYELFSYSIFVAIDLVSESRDIAPEFLDKYEFVLAKQDFVLSLTSNTASVLNETLEIFKSSEIEKLENLIATRKLKIKIKRDAPHNHFGTLIESRLP